MHRRVIGLVALLMALIVAATAWAASTSGQSPASTSAKITAANRALAAKVAAQMLDRLVLPAGSATSAPQLSGLGQALERPADGLFVASEFTQTRFWTSTATPLAVMQSIGTHLPAGTKTPGYGSSSDSLNAAWQLPVPPHGAIEVEQLNVTAAAPQTTTVVRVDAEVQYVAPRPAAQQIPPAAHVLDVSEVGTAPHKRDLHLTVTDAGTVARIAALVDALPFEGNDRGVAFSCPDFTGADDSDVFTFRATATGPALAIVTEYADTPTVIDPCADTTVKIGSRTLPPVMQGGILLKRASAILRHSLTVYP